MNVPALLDLLDKPEYDHREYWYLGKPSLKSSITIPDPDSKKVNTNFYFNLVQAAFVHLGRDVKIGLKEKLFWR